MRLPRWLRWRSSSELDEEIAAHLEAETRAGIERGLAPGEARYAALRKMGNATQVKERAREADPLFWIESVFKDVHYAGRRLAHSPMFTLAAGLSLALGIGVNSAIFSFVDSLVLRPLEVPRPAEIVRVFASTPDLRFGHSSYREYSALRDRNQTLAGLVAEEDTFFAVQQKADDLSRFAYGDFVSGNYFSVLGVQPALGRTFLPQEDTPELHEIPAVLSHQAWEAKFHSDPNITGSQLRLNGEPATIVGVLPERFGGTMSLAPEIYLPLHAMARMGDAGALTNPLDRSFFMLGRLKVGAGLPAIRAEFAGLSASLERAYPDTNKQRAFTALTDRQSRAQQAPQYEFAAIGMLLTAFAVLWIACMNVANMLLGRGSARAKEISIRLAVGAGRGRVIRQLLTESVLLAALGTAGGLLLGSWAIHMLTSIRIPSDLPIAITARMDERVLLYSLGAMAASALMFGLAPSLRVTKVDLISAVKTTGGGPRYRLVTAQAALSVITLVLAGLFVKDFVLSAQSSPGFRTENTLLMTFDPSMAGYSQAQTAVLYRQILDRVRALPSVREASLGSHVQLGPSNSSTSVFLDGKDMGYVTFNRVAPGFFDTTATQILRGRAIDDRDTGNTPPVVIVNETLARRLAPNGDVIGRHVRLHTATGPPAEIVGVAHDAKYNQWSEPATAYMYIPYTQDWQSRMTLFVHTAGDPTAMTAPIRAEIKALAPSLLVFDIRTMRQVFEGYGLLPARIAAQTMAAMGLTGLALTVLGLYAVMAFLVTRRTREIGIRMALGATSGGVQREVLAAGLKCAALGIAIGIALSLALTHYLSRPFTHVNPRDPVVFVSVPAVLLLVAAAACWAPAHRASRVDPASTLRYE